MAKRTCTEELAEEFKALRVEGDVHLPTAVLTAHVKRLSEISDADLREWVTVEEDPANKKSKVSIQMNIFNPPAWLSDPAPVEIRMLNEAVSGMMGNPAPKEELEPTSAPPLLDGACAVFEEAAKRHRRFAHVIQEAFEVSDPCVAVQKIMAFAATEVSTVAYGVAFPPEEVAAPVVTVTAVPEAFELEPDHAQPEDEDINGFYGMGTSDHDAPSVDNIGEAPRWSYLDQYHHYSAPVVKSDVATIAPSYHNFLVTILKDAMGIGDQPMIDRLTAMGVDPNYEPPVLPPSPCFLAEEQNAVVA